MRRLTLLAVTALALSACGKAQEPMAPGPPPEAVINAGQPMDAVGVDPAWGLKIRGLQFTFDRPGQPQIVATAPGAVIQPGEVSWAAATPDGQSLKVHLYSSLCSDGVSDTRYSFSAEVTLPDGALLAGCAGPPAVAKAQAPAQAKR